MKSLALYKFNLIESNEFFKSSNIVCSKALISLTKHMTKDEIND